MAQIIVMDGPGVGTTFELAQANILGSGGRSNIRLESPNVGEEQAVINHKGGGYVIQSNKAGVMVNGQPVSAERQLMHGDMITLADVMLLYGEESEGSDVASTIDDPEVQKLIKSRQKYFKDTKAALDILGQSKNAARHMETLLKVSNAIMAKLEMKDLLQKLLDIIFEELPADRGTVFLRDQKANKLWPMASKKRTEIGETSKLMASRTIIKEVLETKEGILTKDAQDDGRFNMGMSIAAQKIHAALCVPMVGKEDNIIGIIHIDAVRSDRVFTEDHLKLVTAIAMQATLAAENALLVQQLGEKSRMEQELNIASNIQMELLPSEIPDVSGVNVYGLMRPAKEVGGDYYDFIASEDNAELYVCIGDVSGKGVPAGLVMVMARCFFKPLILSCRNTKLILQELNKFLVEDTRKDMFMSMLVLKWDIKENLFTYTGAGHEHLIIYRAATKTCEAIRAGGIVLGMMKRAGSFFQEKTQNLAPGDAIVLYTDGVTEAVSPSGEMFELERLTDLVKKCAHMDAEKITKTILVELDKFMAKTPQHDDITIVAIKKE